MIKYKNEFSIKIMLKIGEMDVISDDQAGLTYILSRYHNKRGVKIKVVNGSDLVTYKYILVAPDAILYDIIRKWSELGTIKIEVI